jgi:hypothetical protein
VLGGVGGEGEHVADSFEALFLRPVADRV